MRRRWRSGTVLPVLALLLVVSGPARRSAGDGSAPLPPYGVEVEVFAIRATTTDPLATRAALLELIARFRPAGGAPERDLGAAYLALFSPDIAPPGLDQALVLAGDILRRDPATTAAWPLLERLRVLYATGRQRITNSNPKIRRWIREVRADPKSEASLALVLLEAHLDFDEENLPLARSGAASVSAAGAGSPNLKSAAADLHRRAGLLHRGASAPPFRMPLADGSGDVSLDDLGGRCVLLLFDRSDRVASELTHAATTLLEALPGHELAGVRVPVGKLPLRPASPEWLDVRAGAVNAKMAEHYGSVGFSALFLISPDRTILMSSGWRDPGGAARARTLLAEAIGMRTTVILARAGRGREWGGFREAVARLRLRAKVLGHPGVASAAARSGPRAMLALIVAAASEGIDLRRKIMRSERDLRMSLGLAWADARVGNDEKRWNELTRDLASPDTDGCLVTVDALFDLGLAGERVRQAIRTPILRSQKWRTVSMALRCLGFQTTEEDPKRVVKHKGADRWQVRLALAEGLKAHRHKAAVDALIELLGDERRRVRVAAAESLETLTGRSLGPDQRAWSAWRREQGTKVVFPPRELTVESLSADFGRAYGWQGFFDLKLVSDRVVFLLDKSHSMFYGLFDGVVDEMKATLESAGPTTRFAVIQFADEPEVFRHMLVPVNRRTIQDAVDFLRRSRPYGATNIMDTLDLGLAVDEAGAVVLLSDGVPNRGREMNVEKILAQVTAGNRYRRISIHTVWMLKGRAFPHDGPTGDDRPPLDDGEIARRREIRESATKHALGSFLLRLARANGGTFAVAFGDYNQPPPGAKYGENTDK